jgi:arylsulfatase A-like enzyme
MISLLFALMLTSLQSPPASTTPSLPNVLLLYADDLGWADLGVYGGEFYRTPRLDGLAGEGVRFTNAYANAPNCAPSRACLMTGTYSPRHGVYTVAPSSRGKTEDRRVLVPRTLRQIEPSTWTIAEALSAAGYRCATIGKWHLGDDPTEHGFDLNVGGTQQGHPKSYFSPYKNKNLSDGPTGEHLTERLTREAIKFIDEEGNRPFFLYLPYFSVHTPLQGRPDLVAEYRELRGKREGKLPKPAYAAMVQAMDESVGALLDHLDERELAENTLVIFTSDNGGHGKNTSMGPLRGSKGMLYEGGIREPLIVRWPGRIEAGRVSDEVVIGTDIFPTLLEAAGVEAPEDSVLDGVSLMTLLTEGGTLEREAIFWHFPAYLEAYSRKAGGWRTTPAGALRAGDYKLIEFFESGRLELYDLAQDIGEASDLSDELPEKRDELHALLRTWQERVGAPLPTEPNPEFAGEH